MRSMRSDHRGEGGPEKQNEVAQGRWDLLMSYMDARGPRGCSQAMTEPEQRRNQAPDGEMDEQRQEFSQKHTVPESSRGYGNAPGVRLRRGSGDA